MPKPIMFLGYDLRKVNWYLVLYVIFSIAFLIGGVTRLSPMGMPRTVIFAIGSTLILYFFGQRWFGGKNTGYSGKWPPSINTCPDYLTFLPTLPGKTTGGCVDVLGVSSNNGLRQVNDSDLSATDALPSNKVFPYTSADVTDATDKSSLKAICTACSQYGVTWEGVWDGDTCVGSSSYGNEPDPLANCPL